MANAFVFAASQPPVFAASFGGWGRFASADGFYALALQTGVYTFTVVPPDDSALPELTVPLVEVQEDLTLDFDYYTTFLPIVLSFCPYQSTRPPLQGTDNFAGEVEILTPPNCATDWPAETRILVTGTYTETPADVTLWVLAYAPDSLYYVQSPNACAGEPPSQEGGDWQVPVYLGKKGGDPEWFDIVVILTDQTASQFLSDWVREGCEAEEYEGILAATLNKKAITEKSYITVQTLD